MSGNVLRLATIVAIFALVTGCVTRTIIQENDCPLRPELIPIDVELQADIPPHTLLIIAQNQLKLKKHIKDLEAIANCTTP